MIILDTNVISELMTPDPHAGVITWLNAQPYDTVFTTCITLAEVNAGLSQLPEGKRRRDLERRANMTFNMFADRLLDFDADAATHFGVVTARAKQAGHRISFADSLIAAIADSHNFSVATRDVEPFVAAQVSVLDPWDAP